MFVDKSFGRYELLEAMTRTGAGIVYRAMDNDFEGQVAIKFLPPYYYQDPSQRFKFEQEARILALLENPFITPILEIGEWEGRLFIVMQWLEGGTLADRLLNGPIPFDDAIDIFYNVAKILETTHELDIFHRDLKPTNILFDTDEEVYLTDFGMLKLAETNPEWAGGYFVGSPDYISWDAVSPIENIDERADIYALGCLLFTMITGFSYVEGDTFTEKIQHFSSSRELVLEQLPADLPEIFREALVEMLTHGSEGNGSITEMLEDMFESSADDYGIQLAEPVDILQEDLPAAEMRAQPVKRIMFSLSLLIIISVFGLGWSLYTGLLQKNLAPKVLNQPWVSTSLAYVNLPGQGKITSATVDATSTGNITVPTDVGLAMTSVQPVVVDIANTPIPTSSPTLLPESPPELTSVPEPTEELIATGPVIGGADKIAFLHDDDIWMADLDGKNLERLTTDGEVKDILRWTPDGRQLIVVINRIYYTLQVSDLSLRKIGSFEDLDISPDMKTAVVGNMVVHDREIKKWMNAFIGFNSINSSLDSTTMKKGMKCSFYAGRLTHYSKDGQRLSSVIQTSQNGKLYEVIEVLDITPCGQEPARVDYFLGGDFPIRGYNGLKDPRTILDYTWDGMTRFVLTGNVRNEYGDMIAYDINTRKYQLLDPLQGKCCFRYSRWSPDGSYLLFAFVDVRYGDKVELYYVPWEEISSRNVITPLSLPAYMFEERLENIQPALRPVQ